MLLHALLFAYVGRFGSGSRALSLSLKECLSVFKPVQHAAQPSPLKRQLMLSKAPEGFHNHTQKIFKKEKN